MTPFAPYPITEDDSGPPAPPAPPAPAWSVARLISTFAGIACSAFARIRPSPAPQMFLAVNDRSLRCPVTERILERHAESPIPGLVVTPVVRPLEALTLVVVAPHPRSRITFLTSVDDIIFALFGTKGLDKSLETIETEKRDALKGLADPSPVVSDEAPDGDAFAPLEVPMLVPDREAPTVEEWDEVLSLARQNMCAPPGEADSVLQVSRTDQLSQALVRALAKGLGDKSALQKIRLESTDDVSRPTLRFTSSDGVQIYAGALHALGLVAKVQINYGGRSALKKEAFIVVREREIQKPSP